MPRSPASSCTGPVAATGYRPSRRELLRAGLVGFTGLTLSDFYRLSTPASQYQNWLEPRND